MNAFPKFLVTASVLTGLTLAARPALPQTPAVLPAPATAQSALTALLAQPAGPLPPGTKLLSLRVADGLATVNFSHELRDNFSGGDTAETHAVNAVLRTLGQFPTVSRAQIWVEGRPLDSLGGLLALSTPLPVIRPADAAVAQAGKRWLHRKPRLTNHPSKTP